MPTSTLSPGNLLDSLMQVIDPEVGINIVDLGLVYAIHVTGTEATVEMTLTTPGCPLHASIEAAVDCGGPALCRLMEEARVDRPAPVGRVVVGPEKRSAREEREGVGVRVRVREVVAVADPGCGCGSRYGRLDRAAVEEGQLLQQAP